MRSPFESILHTNAVPPDGDCDRMREFLVDPRKQLSDICQEILQVQSHLEDLTQKPDELSSVIDAHLSLSPQTTRGYHSCDLQSVHAIGSQCHHEPSELPSPSPRSLEHGDMLPSRHPNSWHLSISLSHANQNWIACSRQSRFGYHDPELFPVHFSCIICTNRP